MTMQGQGDAYAAHVEAFDLHGQYEERAAIIEYDGGFPRQVAEARARIEVYGKSHKSYERGNQS